MKTSSKTLKAFAVRDQKGECFRTPFFLKTPGEAIRDFSKLCKDPQSMLNQFPEDYDLYAVGEFDEDLGTFLSYDTPRHLEKAINHKPQ